MLVTGGKYVIAKWYVFLCIAIVFSFAAYALDLLGTVLLLSLVIGFVGRKVLSPINQHEE